MQPANYEHRLVSYIIDLALSFLIATILHFLGIVSRTFFSNVLFTMTFAIYGLYTFIFTYFFRGLTLGGLLLNVKIVEDDWGRLRFGKALMRALLLSLVVLVVYNVVYMIVKRTQVSFFDEATSTMAIKKVKNRS